MKRLFILLIIGALISDFAFSAPFARWTKAELILDNGVVKRVIKIPGFHPDRIYP